MGRLTIFAWLCIFVGFVLLVVAAYYQWFHKEAFDGPNNYEWKPLGKTAWFPVFGNTYAYNNKLEYKKQGSGAKQYYRYRVLSPNSAIYNVVQIHKLHNGDVIQVASPTNPMSVEMAVQINDGKYWTSN